MLIWGISVNLIQASTQKCGRQIIHPNKTTPMSQFLDLHFLYIIIDL